MGFVEKDLLINHRVIEDVFEYGDIDPGLSQIYAYFENSFLKLFEGYASAFNIKDYCFYIKNNDTCNAFALKKKGYNIIGITNGYPILLKKKLDEKYFKKILIVGLLNDPVISEAYCDLEEDLGFNFSQFILDCSIKFTFNHEFQHILQLNADSFIKGDYLLHENLERKEFDFKKHAWEFDADRMASYEVLKYVFRTYSKLKDKNNEKLTCLLFIGCASIIITKNLFYFGIINQLNPIYSIKKIKFYTKENSHPHPLVRTFNIMEYYYDNITNDFPKLKIEPKELLINVLGIMNPYFNSLIPNQDVMSYLYDDLDMHLDDINKYNQEIYDFAIQDNAIKSLLLSRGIKID